jgi:peptidoglycan/xylan/chitin deacetylase (PgdA/CDA1 family)
MVTLRLAVVVALLATTAAAGEIAVTIDDLPAVGAQTLAQHQQITRDLLRSLKRHGVPAIGFVNEQKLRYGDASTRLLEQWLDAGFELGNHTFSHPDLHRIDVAQFEKNILEGERVTRRLMKARGKTLRWFRHPFLHTGMSLETKHRVERFLTKHGYRVAPVSMDNSEWIFSRAYDLKIDDAAAKKRLEDEYIAYMDRKTAYWEEQSKRLFGRDIRHTLLIHANALNAATFDRLAEMLKRRGHRFIPIDRALEDDAYRSRDTYTGRAGPSWIHRWAITQGKGREFFGDEPKVAAWVLDMAGMEAE